MTMMEGSAELRLDLAREPHFDYLDPESLRLYRDESGRLRLVIEANRSYLDVKVVRAFPFSQPDQFISFLDDRDKAIGLLERLDALDADSRDTATAELRRRYFIPTIRQVLSLREQYGVIYVEVDTDYGRREFVAKGLRDAIVDLGGGELLICDVDGNRYRVTDWRKLNTASRRFLERVV
ncbi:MAG: DUF1854 domain-containing protein [bacterium]|nr:DUF1854 domain-containing protein [bacterium]